MIFAGIENQIVEFRITNYQFPENTKGDWDSNWLNIYLRVDCKLGKWQVTDPSLTTWEIQEIIEWFDQLANFREPNYKLMSFTEPNLSFELLNKFSDNILHIRMKFDLELRPMSAPDDYEYFMDLSMDRNAIHGIISGLKLELQKYPERKPPV